MTIAHGYLSGTATVGGVSFNGASGFSLSEGVTSQLETKSDGELYEQRTVLIPDNVTGSVSGRNLETTAAIGASGTLTLTASRRTTGVTGTSTVTLSAVSSTITGIERSTDINGNTTVTINFRVNSADGAASGLSIASA